MYQQLISQHLADILSMPPAILTSCMLKLGAFSVSITGRSWHSVAIDEAHEMLINEVCKISVVRPTQDYINRIAQYMLYWNKTLDNLKQTLLPESKPKENNVTCPFSSSNDKKYEQNVKAQMELIHHKSLFQVAATNCGLINPFTNQKGYLTTKS